MLACRSKISAFALAVLFAFAHAASASEVAVDRHYNSAALGRQANYSIVRPDKAQGTLPVVYLLHGRDSSAAEWLRLGQVAETLDRLVVQRRIPPLLLVLPDTGNGWYVDGPAMAAETAIVRDLAADVAALAHAHHDDAAWAVAHGRHRGHEGRAGIAQGTHPMNKVSSWPVMSCSRTAAS